MKKQVLSSALVALGFLRGATALSALADWTGPHSAPPTCITDPSNSNFDAGCLPPINVGTPTGPGQVKLDLLGLANFQFTPPGMAGKVSVGSVLTALDNNGTVGWQSVAAAGSPSCNNVPVSITDATTYHNTSAHVLMVTASVKLPTFQVNIIGNEGPSSGSMSEAASSGGIGSASVTFAVPPGAYYSTRLNTVGSGAVFEGQSVQLCP